MATQAQRRLDLLAAQLQDPLNDVVVIDAVRTPMCKAKRGSFKDLPPEGMLHFVFKAIVERTKIDPKEIQDVCIGNCLQGGSGGITSRQAQFLAGWPMSATTMGVNRQCSSGITACSIIANAIKSGQIEVGVAGGVESMSLYPMTAQINAEAIWQPVFQNELARDCMMPMGITSENVSEQYNIPRDVQDLFAFESFNKALNAMKQGKFKEQIVRCELDGKIIDQDEGPRPTKLQDLQKLRPAFKPNGCSTAGNSSQMTDGAACVLLASRRAAKRLGLPVVGKFVDFTVVGVPPSIMGVGPAYAVPELLKRNGLTVDQVAVYEINEAFASQAIYSVEKVGIPKDRVNPNGGAIALGHPLGMTGARMVADLLPELRRRKARYGVISMCLGTGMGAAALFENEVL